MVGDTQASVQQLSDRVDKVLDLQRQEAKKLEQMIGGVVQSVERAFTAVAESNAAHTSKLEETLTRCARLEQVLSAQSKAIEGLSAKCDLVLSQTNNLASLAPLIQTNQSDSRLWSAETKIHISEHAQATYTSLDKVREEIKCAREAWDGALSLHRRETSVMFSAVLAGISRIPPLNEHADRRSETSRSGIVPPAPAPAPAPTHTVDITHKPPPPHGQSSSSSSSGLVTTSDEPQTQHEHAAKNPDHARHTQSGTVHDKNSTAFASRVLVEETQSTALSSVPDEDHPPEEERVMTFERGRGFGALSSRRTGSALASVTIPASPGFTVQRRPFVQVSSLQSAPKQPDSSASRGQAATPAPTVGRPSSPNEDASSLRPALNKRSARIEDVPPNPAKRSRKNKTRVLMDSQELLRLDSSPER
ncbi:unnamed protein product [Rhizoctonia solani]|uniref:Uncharacterized protein n=1 Tax=Rhizoctonia solani TaxID=456999 RepID=A0A8H3GJS2_9AGAM|nr:unnamed protein product [Rhizoctonia solani]